MEEVGLKKLSDEELKKIYDTFKHANNQLVMDLLMHIKFQEKEIEDLHMDQAGEDL